MPKMSDELDEPTMKLIVGKLGGGSMQGNCARCMAPIDATHYEYLRAVDRVCQVCKMLKIPKPWKEVNP